MKTMSNLIHHKLEDDGDGSSTTGVTQTVNVVRDVSARRTAVITWWLSTEEECAGLGHPEQRSDDVRTISIWEGADRCSEYFGVK